MFLVDRGFRYASNHRFQVERGGRYSTDLYTIRRGFRYKAPREYQLERGGRYRSLEDTLVNVVTGAGSPSVFVPGQGVYQRTAIQVTVQVDGVSLVLHGASERRVVTFTRTRSRNQPLTWSMTLADPLGILSPHRSDSIWFRVLDRRAFKTVGGVPTLRKWLDVNLAIELDGNLVVASVNGLVIKSREYSADENGRSLTISGTDKVGRLLTRRGINLDSIISKNTQVIMASTVIKRILTACGITKWQLTFDDYPIRQNHIINEQPIDAINKILEIPAALWYTDGDTFFVRQPTLLTSSADWQYEDRKNIFSLRESEDSDNEINDVTVGFPSQNPNTKVVKDGTGWGRFPVPIDPPITGVPKFSAPLEADGVVTSVDFFDVNDVWVGHFVINPMQVAISTGLGAPGVIISLPETGIPPAVDGTISPPGAAITNALFNFVPPANAIVDRTTGAIIGNPRWRVQVTGPSRQVQTLSAFIPAPVPTFSVPPEILQAQVNFENSVNGTGDTSTFQDSSQVTSTRVIDQASINENGTLTTDQPIINTLLPNLMWAWRMGVQVILQSRRSQGAIQFVVPVNPFLILGDLVGVIDSVAGINRNYTVEEESFSISAEQGIKSNFTGYPYLT